MAMDIAVEWDSKTYDLQFASITPKEWRLLKTHLGLKAGAFMNSFSGDVEALDSDACVALLWLMQKRAGEHEGTANDLAKVADGDLDLFAFVEAIGTEMRKRQEEAEQDEAGEVPKAGSGT